MIKFIWQNSVADFPLTILQSWICKNHTFYPRKCHVADTSASDLSHTYVLFLVNKIYAAKNQRMLGILKKKQKKKKKFVC